MRTFDYTRAGTAEEALRLAANGATYLAGGTNLVDLMKLGVVRPQRVIDVNELPYDFVAALADGGVQIGATVRNSDLAAHPLIRRGYPVLSQALLAGASGQLRNMATTAGNLLQRTRCLYFQDVTKPCNKRQPGSGCPARTGEHRDLAVLGASEACIATHPSDMAVAMAALDAIVHVQSADGPDEIALADFLRLPGESPEIETTVPAGTLVTAVRLPPLPTGMRSSYRKVRDRASYAFAVVSVAAGLQLADDQTVRDVRLAFGGVAHKPWRASVAERSLRGGRADPDAFKAAIDAELAVADPLPGNAFKVPLLTAVAVDALSGLLEGDRT